MESVNSAGGSPPTTVTVDADTIATMVALPVAVSHISAKLRQHAAELTLLASNLTEQTADIAEAFPAVADPLAAIHLERDVSGEIPTEIAAQMGMLAKGLHLVETMVDLEVIELMIGPEELAQTIAVLAAAAGLPAPPVLHAV